MIALDASAVLALMHREPGAEYVATRLQSAVMSSVNLAEVLGKLVDVQIDPTPVPPLLRSMGVRIEPFTESDARLAAALRESPRLVRSHWATDAASRWRCETRPPRPSPPTEHGRKWLSTFPP